MTVVDCSLVIPSTLLSNLRFIPAVIMSSINQEQSNPVLYRACLYGAAESFIVFKFLQTTAKVNEVSMLKQNAFTVSLGASDCV